MPMPIDRDVVQQLLAEDAQLVEVLPQAKHEEESTLRARLTVP